MILIFENWSWVTMYNVRTKLISIGNKKKKKIGNLCEYLKTGDFIL